MKFDWLKFLNSNNIVYVTEGKNVARGNIAIKCPFCGPADPSEHMGISIETGAWGCWRNSAHRGRKPHKLIMKLLRCSYATACEIVGDSFNVQIDEFSNFINTLKGEGSKRDIISDCVKELTFPSEIKKIDRFRRLSSRFLQYLSERGFGLDSCDVADFYNLHYSLYGEWANRVIIPVYHKNQLVSWTGRSIFENSKLRYKTFSKKDGAIMSLKELVFEPPGIMNGGKVLVVTEGPFDAIKFDFYARGFSVRATCVFGVGFTADQVNCLRFMASRFKKIVVLFDRGAESQGLSLQQSLVPFNCVVTNIPHEYSDPGELSNDQIVKMAKTFLQSL